MHLPDCVLYLLLVRVNKKTRRVDALMANALKMGLIPGAHSAAAQRKKAVIAD